jgi:transcriptional regulator with PAS, ATPase and Fis domain
MDRSAFQERFGIIGESPEIRHVTDKIVQIAATDISVLLQGESGVGKDVVARAIHGLSHRKHKPIVIVNCGAIPEGIIESELFGHEKGSFTGAHETRQGYFEKANGGTIFLDEIADTPKNIQVKLLRILESGEFFRVGSAEARKADVRIIAASNKDLIDSVSAGQFREDLYYRLNTITIRIPPLRERAEDILLIFRKFVQEFSVKYDSVFQGFSDEARQLLVAYRWPGNIRELRNVAEQLVVLEKSQFITPEILARYLTGRQRQAQPDHLPALLESHKSASNPYGNAADGGDWIWRTLIEMQHEIRELRQMVATLLMAQGHQAAGRPPLSLPPPRVAAWDSDAPVRHVNEVPLGVQGIPDAEIDNGSKDRNHIISTADANGELPSLEEAEHQLIIRALDQYDGNRRKAAEALGISERTLYRKIEQLKG